MIYSNSKKALLVSFLILPVLLYSQTLDEYIEIAKHNNSKIKVVSSVYEIAKEKITEVANLENTTLSFGVFTSTPETRVGSQLFKLGASQKLPWFGEFQVKKERLNALANVKRYDIALSERDIEFQVKQAYYEIYQQVAITAILDENKQILETYEGMALGALSNNRATMSDVLRVRVQINELTNKILQNRNSIQILKTNFKRLLQSTDEKPLQIADSLTIQDVFINELSVNQHPSLVKITEMDTVYQLQKKLITIDSKPKLSVGLDYILVNKRTDISINQNGKDILMPKIALSVPLFNKKFSSQLKQITIAQQSLTDELIRQKNTLEIAVDKAVLMFKNAVLSFEVAQQNNEELQRAINVDLKAYETGILDYDKILRLQIQKINIQLKEIEAIKNAFIAKAKLTYLSN